MLEVLQMDNDNITLKFLYNKPNGSLSDWPLRDDMFSTPEVYFSWYTGCNLSFLKSKVF